MVIMKNLSPTESGTKKVFGQIFPPEDNYILDILHSDEFKAFLINDATTTQGRMQLQNILELMKSGKMLNQKLRRLNNIINCSIL